MKLIELIKLDKNNIANITIAVFMTAILIQKFPQFNENFVSEGQSINERFELNDLTTNNIKTKPLNSVHHKDLIAARIHDFIFFKVR